MMHILRRVFPMQTTTRSLRPVAGLAIAFLAYLPTAPLAAQSLEGSKWTVEQEGVETPVLWWLGGQGRVRVGEFGTILTGYSWRQDGDSVFIAVGDSVRYAALLMSNRLVGVRTGPRRQEGWWSGVRADGPTALAVAQDFQPSLVLLDIVMPGMDGYEVARRLRGNGFKDVVLAALTGWGQESDRARSREAGFDHHLVKPVEPDTVQKLLTDRV